MKDYMANGRFSRGVEVIADASMAFVGNIDMSVEQIVHSTEYDLFQPLPEQFDLAVMDRFACYLPGWEMPKNSSAFLTERFGLITDYLAEAFHHQLKHSNRYEEVSKRVRLGSNVEGRDEKGIKKTLCAMLKILHPADSPTDEEFDEYVAYAVECRRRVKEQMNKRKPDDEFARIDLSFLDRNGKEVVINCPESFGASATLEPARRPLRTKAQETRGPVATASASPARRPAEAPPTLEASAPAAELDGPTERHYAIAYDDTGHSYDTIFGPYLLGAKSVVVEDPYIRMPHQIANFVRFCETVVKAATVRRVSLVTSYDQQTDMAGLQEKLDELKQSLLEYDVRWTCVWTVSCMTAKFDSTTAGPSRSGAAWTSTKSPMAGSRSARQISACGPVWRRKLTCSELRARHSEQIGRLRRARPPKVAPTETRSEGFPRGEMETGIEPMVRRSKNEGGNAHCKATASSASDTEKPPYELTAREKEALCFEAASETRGPRS
jgi:hypothetical protein